MDTLSSLIDRLETKLVQEWLPSMRPFLWVFLAVVVIYIAWVISQYALVWSMTKRMNVIQFVLPRDNENEPHQMNLACKAIWKCYPWYFRLFMAQPYYSFEIHATTDEITFNIVAPENFTETIEKTVHSVYKDAESRIFAAGSQEDYLAGYRGAYTSIGHVVLEKHSVFSLQTFKDWTQDPLSTITSSMTKLEEGQEVTLQVLCRPIGDFFWQMEGRRALRRYERTGAVPRGRGLGPLRTLIWLLSIPLRLVAFIFSLFFVNRTREQRKAEAKQLKEKEKGQVELKEQKSISGKVTQHGYHVSIRIITKDLKNNRKHRREAIRDVAIALHQLDAENEVRQRHIIWLPKLLRFFTLSRYLPLHGRSDVLSTTELASLFHLPNKDVMTPNIKRIRSKHMPPPATATRAENVVFESRYRGKVEPIGIKESDLDKSVYILGKQGTGKSELIQGLALEGVRKQRGAHILIDPHGDMAASMIGRIPEWAIEDTFYLDFSDFEFPPGLNMLDKRRFRGKNLTLVKEQALGVLKKEFADAWGASTEDILRNAIELSLVSEGSSLLEVMLAIVSSDFRREYLDKLDNYVVKGYWKNEFEQLNERFRSQITNAPLNKLRRIVGDPIAQRIFCQREMTVDLADLFASNKTIIVNLAKGAIGEENSRLLGSMLISLVYLLMQERIYTMPDQKSRPKLTIYVDELQNYVSESVSDILSELRKFGGRMVAGHQYRSQFDDERIKDGVYQLSRTKIFFNIGEDDAIYVGERTPPFTASDFTSIENFQCVAKMLIDGNEYPPFTLHTLPLKYEYRQDVADRVIERSRKAFYRGESAIEDIRKRYLRFVPDDSEIASVTIRRPEETAPAAPSPADHTLHAADQEKTPDDASTGKIRLVNRSKPTQQDGESQQPVIVPATESASADSPAAQNKTAAAEEIKPKPKKPRTKKKKTESPGDGPSKDAIPEVAPAEPIAEGITSVISSESEEPAADASILEVAAADEKPDVPVSQDPQAELVESDEEPAALTDSDEKKQGNPSEAAEEDFGIKIVGFGSRRKERN